MSVTAPAGNKLEPFKNQNKRIENKNTNAIIPLNIEKLRGLWIAKMGPVF